MTRQAPADPSSQDPRPARPPASPRIAGERWRQALARFISEAWRKSLARSLAGALKHPTWPAAALVLVALALRAWDIDRMSIWQDEGLTLYRASLGLGGILSGEIPLDQLVTPDVQPPLYFLILAGWLRLAGLSVGDPAAIWAGKWLSMLVGLPGIALVWVLARRLLAQRSAALVATLLTALSPALLWYSQELRSYSLQLSLGLLAVYALARALDAMEGRSGSDAMSGSSKAAPKATLAWASLSALAAGLLLWTHYLGIFLVAALALTALLRVVEARGSGLRSSGVPGPGSSPDPGSSVHRPGAGDHSPRWRGLLPLVAAGLAALPLLPYAFWRLELGAERHQHFVPLRDFLRDLSFGFGMGKSARAWHLAEPAQNLPSLAAELGFGFLILAGLAWLWRQAGLRRRALPLLAGYLLLPILGLYALTFLKPVYMGVRHILLAAPAAYLLAGAGWIGLEARRKGLGWIALGLALAGMVLADWGYYRSPAFAKDDHRGLAQYVAARALPGDVLAVTDSVLSHTYRPLLPHLPILVLPGVAADGRVDERPPGDALRPILAEYGRIWFVDPDADYEDWLGRYALEVDRRNFASPSIVLDLHAYERDPNLRGSQAPMRRDDLALGDLTLLGWDTHPEVLVAGRPARIRLIWKVETRSRPDYKVALELVDAEGQVRARSDHAPFQGLRPSSSWDFGSLVYAPQDLAPSAGMAPGSYRLRLRIYDPASGEALPAEGPAELGQVEVITPDPPIDPLAVAMDHRLQARGRGFELVGYDLPQPGSGARAMDGGSWTAGEDLPLGIWLRWRSSDGRLPQGLRSQIIDRFGRVVAEDLRPIDAKLAGSGRLLELSPKLTLPAGAGFYGLRVSLVDWKGGAEAGTSTDSADSTESTDSADSTGSAASPMPASSEPGRPRAFGMLRGYPLPLLPVRSLWLSEIRVAAPQRQRAVPPMQQRLDATVGEGAELLGFDGPVERIDPSQSPELPITLYWRAVGRMPLRYRVTLQLLPLDAQSGEPAGPPLAQRDAEPAEGARPTTGWLPGEVIVDPHRLTLPADLPAGEYLLIAALYDPERPDQARPQVRQAGALRDFVRLTTLSIGAAVESAPASEPSPTTEPSP